jgi:hypothetical protein
MSWLPFAGAGRAAVGNCRRRRKTPPASPPLQALVEIGPRDPSGRPPPAPGRSWPPVRRNLAGPPPAGAWGLHCKVCDISGCFVWSKGMVVNLQKLPGASAQNCNFNSVPIFLKLVKCVENHRKFRKMQTQFCWMPGKNYYNFCYTHMVWILIFLAWKIEMWKT